MKKRIKTLTANSSIGNLFLMSLSQLIILLLFFFFLSSAYAQCTARPLPYTEAFASNPLQPCTPTLGGWSGTSAASGAAWWVPSPATNYAGGTAPEIEAYGDQANGGVSETIRLTSPPVKVLGISSASLSFKHNLYLTNSAASGSSIIGIGVEMSPDNITWTPLYSNTYVATSSLTSVVQETRTIALNGLASDSIFIRFNISGVLFKVWGWEIDDVNITSSGSAGIRSGQTVNTKIFPNPVKEVLHIEQFENGVSLATIFDVNGNQLIKKEISEKNSSIETGQLSPGIYFVNLISGKESRVLKFVKE